jgi:polysaccharide biosynthesis/export protein
MLRYHVFAAAAAPALAASPASSQQQPPRGATPDTAAALRALQQRLGRPVSQAEALEMIRRSGMSRSQMRAQLQQAGYDPSLVDQYFDMIEGGGQPGTGTAAPEFVTALQRIGVTAAGLPDGSAADAMVRRPDTTRVVGDSADMINGLPVFGRSLFRRGQTEFDPVLSGPVDPDYRLGPGDQLTLVVTGDVELAYTLDVTREGLIFIPDVGQLAVAGLTLDELDRRLYDRLGRVYSGITRRDGATTRYQASLGRLRVNQVFVIGDVMDPGAYQVSSVARVLNALYRAGGPTVDGSFRRIEVHRGGARVRVFDLYEYLLRGDSRSDIRLQQDDRVFVPPAGARVSIEGSIRRPAIYEVLGGEDLRDVVGFAGGLEANALVRRIQIDRVLPPSQRRPGYGRVLVDVDLDALERGDPVPLEDGDAIRVFAVSDERRNRLIVDGEVRNPGIYEWRNGQSLQDVLDRADGLADGAYLARAHIFRLEPGTGTRRLIQTALLEDPNGSGTAVLLEDRDSIVVLSREAMTPRRLVGISGFVRDPGDYDLADGMTLQDLVLAAGGFVPGAYLLEAELTRAVNPLVRTDTTAIALRIPLTADGSVDLARHSSEGRIPDWLPAGNELTLQHGDRVFVRRAPGFEPARQVQVTGQVIMPGPYVLSSRGDRFTDLLQRAGGLTVQAHAEGIHVIRGGTVVSADLAAALRNPRSRSNVVLEAGDSVHIPAFDPMVMVTGAVNFEARVLYEEGRSISWYIQQAGGLSDGADRRAATITYPNGQRSALRTRVVFPRPVRVEPGSVIHVPEVPDARAGANWDQALARSLSVVSTLATLLLALNQIR